MKITVAEVKKRAGDIERIVIESVDLSLYIARAQIDGAERVIAEKNGKLLKTTNLLAMKRTLKSLADCELVLRQQSAYDEMVGHSYAANANTMEISLGNQPLPEWLS